jgi:chorismate-pyruvate lyase
MEPVLNLFYPLNEFYEQSGLPLPPVVRVDGDAVPEPYKSLLVHERDMTPTVATAYQSAVNLRVLDYSLRDNVFARRIALVLEGDERPVVFGAIKIYLDHFPAAARELVLERKQPLGTILQTQGIVHSSRPQAFIQVESDEVIGGALQLKESGTLYGRRNILFNSSHILAQVLEILPPTSQPIGLVRAGAI